MQRSAGMGCQPFRRSGQRNYDAILITMQMPEMDGLEATRDVRDLGGDRLGIPIIAMTANAMQEDRLLPERLHGCRSTPTNFVRKIAAHTAGLTDQLMPGCRISCTNPRSRPIRRSAGCTGQSYVRA